MSYSPVTLKPTVEHGNLRIANAKKEIVWSTATNGVNPRLVLEDNNNLVVRDQNDVVLWQTNTHQGMPVKHEDIVSNW